jgi:hypothetical protein
MKRKERPDRTSCPLSIHCLRLLDELDLEAARERVEPEALPAPDLGEQHLLARLRSHLPACSICSTLVAEARSERERQRRLLRALLEEAERRTPSSADLILSALREAQLFNHDEGVAASNHHRQNHHTRAFFAPGPGSRQQSSAFSFFPPEPARRGLARTSIQELVVLFALVLLMLLSTGFVTYFLVQRQEGKSVASTSSASLPSLYHSTSWTSVLMLLPSEDGSGRRSVYNYDPFSGQRTQLPISCCDPASAIDGIAHSGRDLLYHQVINDQVVYSTLNSGKAIFSCPCAGATSAVWTSDDRYILVDTGLQILQVDSQEQALPLYSGSLLQGSKLVFYHNDFLYFERNQATLKALYRLDLASGEAQLVATTKVDEPIPTDVTGTSWLLSPTGATIYYTAGGGSSPPIYAVNSDGSNAHPLQRNGIPLGFAEDNRLLFLQAVNGHLAVKKLAATPQQDQVVLADAAPGATGILVNGTALSPYGESLLTEGLYANRSIEIWVSSLVTGAHKLLQRLSGAAANNPPQLIGWDQLPVTATPAAPTPTMEEAAQLSDDWNGLLLASPATDGSLTIANYNYASGHLVPLLSDLPPETQIDGISPDGARLAYHIAQGNVTNYYLLALDSSPPTARLTYSLSGSGGNAIWEDAVTLLINASFGIVSLDTHKGTRKLVMAPLRDSRLAFYHYPYLYFVGEVNRPSEALYRVPLGETGATPQAITPPTPGSSFWLSPDGYTIYYLHHGAGAGLYAVDSDGQNSHRLRPSGVPIGYATDNSLMIMRYNHGAFELVRLGLAPSQDLVLLRDAAPRASKLCGAGDNLEQGHICDSSVALAPYGHHLVVQAGYSDGHYALLAYDLDSGQQVSAETTPVCLLLGYNRYPPA